MVNIFSKLLDSNEKQVKRITNIVSEINSIDDSEFTIKNLSEYTDVLRKNIKDELGELLTKDDLSKEDVAQIKKVLAKELPHAYAMVRKSAELVAKHRHFDVQLMGGISLFEGRLIELATGEGKTLVATLPLYLYALTGLGAQIVTVNDYLARRDGEWCGHIYDALGLTTGIVTSTGAYRFVKDVTGIRDEEEIKAHEDKLPKMNEMHGYNLVSCSKKEAYTCDITYCTNNEIGFDYLRDNMSISLDQMVLRKLFYCIVDEADSILIDESRTPLIVSAPAEQSNDLYVTFAQVVTHLTKEEDYSVDEKQRRVIINDNGIDKVEKMLNVHNLWEDFLLAHHLENALSAKELYQNGDEYIVKDGQVLIVDEFTGRLMEGRRFSEGMHQAIEAKEGVAIKEEARTIATITFQNLFRLYSVLAGMTGTALTEAEEFSKIYNIDVIVVPTNRKVVRKDNNDVIFKTEKGKFGAIVEEIKEKHEKGQPVLVGTTSVDKSEKLSEFLKKEGLEHQVLNAKYHEKEAEIISHAGEKGQITISTNMAGRGTDITLGEGVRDIGGLAVIGTERHESRRIDNQLRGRSGRQGDPGETRFYISLEDNLMRIFGGDRIASIMSGLRFDENIPLEFGIFSKQIESAQKKVESMYFDARKHLVEYDDVLNIQREIVYKRRKYVLSLFSVDVNHVEEDVKKKGEERKTYILEKVEKEIDAVIDARSVDGEIDDLDFAKVQEEVESIIPAGLLEKALEKAGTTKSEWMKLIKLDSKKIIADKLKEQYSFVIEEVYDVCEEIFTPAIFADKNKRDILRIIDILWVEHLDSIDGLKEGIGLSAYSQKDPLIEYKNQAYILFEDLIATIDLQTASTAFKFEVQQVVFEQPFAQIKTNQQQIEAPLQQETFGIDTNKIMTNRPSGEEKKQVQNNSKKLGRNDLCSCGSGKKYKKCGELNTSEHQARMAKLA